MSEHAVMPLEDYKRACDYIRSQTSTTESIKSGELVEKIDALYIKANSEGLNTGFNQGYAEGKTQGYTEGETAGIEQGYAIGFTKGQLDAVQSAEALKGSLSGISVVSAKDVSPYEHKVECSIDRQNLCYQNGNINTGGTSFDASAVVYDETTDTYTINGTIPAVGNIQLTTNIDVPSDTYFIRLVKVSGSITVPSGSVLLGVFAYGSSSVFLSRPTISKSNEGNSDWTAKGTTSSSWNGKATVYLQHTAKGVVYDNFVFKVVISKYDYTHRPYVPDLSAVTLKVGASADDENAQTFTCNADGTVNGEITSIYPEMVISTDNIGVVVNAKYTKDIDAAFNALEQQILLLGGTV